MKQYDDKVCDKIIAVHVDSMLLGQYIYSHENQMLFVESKIVSEYNPKTMNMLRLQLHKQVCIICISLKNCRKTCY